VTEIQIQSHGQDERAERVLDAAAELLLRWGYQRVTIEEVAKHAAIGKGTVYLHFRTKDALFLTVLLRAHHQVIGTMADRMDADPDEALPSRMMRSVYLDLAADPMARALYLGDPDVLGRLSQEASGTLGGLALVRDEVARRTLTLLRDAGCLRTDIGVDEQMHVLGAVGAGFFFVDALPGSPPDPVVRADLMAYAVAAALETPSAHVTPEVAAAVAEAYRSLISHVDDEWRRRVR
jgi:AcrR family transcriptional regulator